MTRLPSLALLRRGVRKLGAGGAGSKSKGVRSSRRAGAAILLRAISRSSRGIFFPVSGQRLRNSRCRLRADAPQMPARNRSEPARTAGNLMPRRPASVPSSSPTSDPAVGGWNRPQTWAKSRLRSSGRSLPASRTTIFRPKTPTCSPPTVARWRWSAGRPMNLATAATVGPQASPGWPVCDRGARDRDLCGSSAARSRRHGIQQHAAPQQADIVADVTTTLTRSRGRRRKQGVLGEDALCGRPRSIGTRVDARTRAGKRTQRAHP